MRQEITSVFVIILLLYCFIVKSNSPALSLLSVYYKPEFEG